MLPLSEGNWPGLQVLDLSCNWLDAEGMALLAKGNWPLLEDIQLYANPGLDAVAIAHLSAANWPLQTLELSHMPFTSAMAAELASQPDSDLPQQHSFHRRCCLSAYRGRLAGVGIPLP